jgi:ribosomal protein S27E
MNTEMKSSPNRQIQALLSGPHPTKPTLAAQLLSCHGISPADTKLLAQWFDSKTLATPFGGKFGYVHQGLNQKIIRVYDTDDQYHELKITLSSGIDYVASIGSYFGYRPCCSQYYSARKLAKKSIKHNDKHVYVHCPKCLSELAIYDREAIIKEITEKRVCTALFPNHSDHTWIRYQMFDAVMRDKMAFSRLKNNKWIRPRR